MVLASLVSIHVLTPLPIRVTSLTTVGKEIIVYSLIKTGNKYRMRDLDGAIRFLRKPRSVGGDFGEDSGFSGASAGSK